MKGRITAAAIPAVLLVLLSWPLKAEGMDLDIAADGATPVHFKADSLRGSAEGDIEAEGGVTVTWREMTLTADKVRYERAASVVRAEGAVRLADEAGNEMNADSVVLDATSLKGEVVKGKLSLRESGYNIRAERFQRTGPETYRAEGASFTACDGTWPSWRVDADWIDVEIEGYLFGGGAVFRVEGVPIAYLPYFFYPVKLTRQSGFLPPRIGFSDTGGFLGGFRYYWAINESVDTTLGLRYESRLGWTETVGVRYVLAEGHEGHFEIEHLRDRLEDEDQVDVRADHEGRFGENTRLDLHVDYAGDRSDRRKYGESLDVRGVAKLESHLYAAHGTEEGTWYGLARFIEALAGPQEDVVQKLPGLGFIGADSPLFGPLRWRTDAEASRFWRAAGERGERFRVAPSLSLDTGWAGLGTRLEGGYRENYYTLRDDDFHHGAGWAEAAVRATLGRGYGNLIHLVEPRLAYRWEEEGRGGTPPEFDAEDRFEDRSEVRLTISNRLFDTRDGREVFALDVERALDLLVLDEQGWAGDPFSPWRGLLAFEPWEGTGLRLDGDYDTNLPERKWLRWTADLHGTDRRGDLIFYRHHYVRDEADYLDAGVEVVLVSGVAAGYRNRYSRHDDLSLERIFSLRLEHPCWEIMGQYARVYLIDDDVYDDRVVVSVSLKGMDRLGKMKW